MKKSSKLNILFGAVFIIIAGSILFYMFNSFSSNRASQTFYAELQRIEVSFRASGFVVKDEEIYFSPADGKVKRIIEAGELVKKGTEVAQIIQSDRKVVSVKTNREGLVTYIKDNCEEKYKDSNVDKLLVEEILEPPVKQERRGGGENVKKGDFLFKIVGNDSIKYVLILDKEDAKKISQNESLVFAVEYPVNMLIEGKIEKLEERENNKYVAIFSTTYYIEPLLNWRKISGRFVFGTFTASYVPETALTKNDKGEDIVFIKDSSGSPKAVKVKVLGKDSSRKSYIVQGLSKFQEVYSDAAFAKEK